MRVLFVYPERYLNIGIPGGISIMSAILKQKGHKVDLFEREDHFGGHSYTLDTLINGKKVPVDIGFIVFNHETYPNLINFLNELKFSNNWIIHINNKSIIYKFFNF